MDPIPGPSTVGRQIDAVAIRGEQPTSADRPQIRERHVPSNVTQESPRRPRIQQYLRGRLTPGDTSPTVEPTLWTPLADVESSSDVHSTVVYAAEFHRGTIAGTPY